MIYLVAVVAAVVAGITAGGSIKGLARLKFNNGWLFLAAFFIQAIFQVIAFRGGVFSDTFTLFLCSAVNMFLFAGFFMNRKLPGMIIAWVGMTLNAVVSLANGGRMPVDMRILEKHGMYSELEAVLSGFDIRHVPIDDDTRLVFLSDWIRPPGFLFILNRIVSVGDVIISIGLFALIFCLVYNFKEGITHNNYTWER